MGGNLRLPASGCPLPLPKGATEVPQPLLSLGDPTSAKQARRVWGTQRGRGPEVQNRSEQNWLQLSMIVISTVSVGRSQTPGRECP